MLTSLHLLDCLQTFGAPPVCFSVGSGGTCPSLTNPAISPAVTLSLAVSPAN